MEGESDDEDSLKKQRDQESKTRQESGCNPTTNSVSKISNHIPDIRPRWQLWLHAALMCGREFLYAVEIALVTPIMLQLGMSEENYSYIWFCSPTLGLLLGLIMGTWSDRCSLKWGRRRPFILGFVSGTFIAFTLLIFSKDIAKLLTPSDSEQNTLGLVFGLFGTQMMDFCLDQLETPMRAFTLDVCSPHDRQRAFTIQTVLMGLGSALGFAVDGIDWEHIFSYQSFGFQLKVVYFCAVVVFLLTAAMTLLSIKEVPWVIKNNSKPNKSSSHTEHLSKSNNGFLAIKSKSESKVIPSIVIHDGKSSQENCICINRHTNSRSTSSYPKYYEDNSGFNNSPSKFSNGTNISKTGEVKTHILSQQNTDASNTAIFASPTLKNVALYPRISLCKSVFLTMSCPEGLNDRLCTSNTSTETVDGDDSSEDDGDDSLGSDPDDATQSLPNISVKDNQSDTRSFLGMMKDKLFSSIPQMSSTAGSSVDKDSHPETNFSSPVVTQEAIQNEKDVIKCDAAELNEIQVVEGSTDKSHSGKTDQAYILDHKKNSNARDVDPEDGDKEILMKNRSGKKKKQKIESEDKPVSFKTLWLSIITMPSRLRYLSFAFFMSFVGIEIITFWYSNIIGRIVYHGDPAAPVNSTERQLYNDGVQMGCWGLVTYAIAMIIFSVSIEKFDLMNRIPLRVIYSGGQLITCISTAIMFLFPTEGVILSLTWTIGVTVTVSVTLPYLLVGQYHLDNKYVMKSPGSSRRGFGTDCAILACQMYAADLVYAAISGPIIMSYGSVKIMILVTSVCHGIAFMTCAFFVTYPGERSFIFRSGKARTVEDVQI